MPLYRLEAKPGSAYATYLARTTQGRYREFIIRAECEAHARNLAAAQASTRAEMRVWRDPNSTTCSVIPSEGKTEIISVIYS